jgi:HSP20 family protein
MKNCLPYSGECLVYPGEYTPVRENMQQGPADKHQAETALSKLLLNLDEHSDHFKIEVQLPGVRRENICIRVIDNILNILVQNGDWLAAHNKLHIHEFNSDRLERQIELPANADAEFVSAEFRQGILELHIPKTTEVFSHSNSDIVVY